MSPRTYRVPTKGNVQAVGRDLDAIINGAAIKIRGLLGDRPFTLTGITASPLSESFGNPIPDIWEATVEFVAENPDPEETQ
jgi:hypothetical protein